MNIDICKMLTYNGVMKFAKYGLNVILAIAVLCIGFAGAIVIAGGGWWAALTALPLLFTLYFFRDPNRKVPDGNVIVSAADGKVTAVEEADESEFVGGKSTRISVFLSVFDVHLNRAPINGKVDYVKHYDGKYFNAMKAKSAVENERNLVGLATDIGKVLVIQIAGAIARRIRCAVKPGDMLNKGQKFGMIMFGSRTDVYLPTDKITVKVKTGDVVRAGVTVLAEVRDGQS